MNVDFQPKKVEERPWHVEAIEQTTDNMLQIAEWVEANHFEVSFGLEGKVNKVLYSCSGWTPRVGVGDYIVVARREGFNDIESVAGWPRDRFEQKFREGWS